MGGALLDHGVRRQRARPEANADTWSSWPTARVCDLAQALLTRAAELLTGTERSGDRRPRFRQLTRTVFDVLAIASITHAHGTSTWPSISLPSRMSTIGSLCNGVLIHRNFRRSRHLANATVTVGDKVQLVAAALGDISSPVSGVRIGRCCRVFLSVLDRPIR